MNILKSIRRLVAAYLALVNEPEAPADRIEGEAW